MVSFITLIKSLLVQRTIYLSLFAIHFILNRVYWFQTTQQTIVVYLFIYQSMLIKYVVFNSNMQATLIWNNLNIVQKQLWIISNFSPNLLISLDNITYIMWIYFKYNGFKFEKKIRSTKMCLINIKMAH